jgi:hypothetical protein
MSNDAGFQLSRCNPYAECRFGSLVVLLPCFLLFQPVDPGPDIIVSPETTYITEPLKPDGLPDYERYLLKLYRGEIRPEDNAAVLLWQALWPGDLEPADHKPFCREIGLASVPRAATALKLIFGEANKQHTQKWLQEHGHSNVTVETIETLLGDAMEQPWKVATFPPFAAWVHENRLALDLISAATQKPKFYSPSPSLLNDIDEPLGDMLLPGATMAREAGRSLTFRAMGYLGEGDIDQSWRDIHGCHRLARLSAKCSLLEQLVGIAISEMACRATLVLLDDQRLSAAQARQIRSDIQSLTEFSSLADSLNTFERLQHLDCVMSLRSGKAGVWKQRLRVPDTLLRAARIPADWNIALRRGNQFYDHMVAIVQMPPGRARDEAIYQLHDDLDQLTDDFPRRAKALTGPNDRKIGDVFARATIALFAPHLDSAVDAHERANTTLHLLRLAASLAVYRAEVGAYPEKFDDLVPRILNKLPVDLYGARTFVYKRHTDGYLLYSVGRNGIDDGGSNERMRVFEGRRIDDTESTTAESAAAKIPSNSDDVSIRVPRPPLELSSLMRQANETTDDE